MLTGYGISLDDASESKVAHVLDASEGRWLFLGCGEDVTGTIRSWFQPTEKNVEAQAVMAANKDNAFKWVETELIAIIGEVPWNYKVTPRVVYSDHLVPGGHSYETGVVSGVYDLRYKRSH